VIIASKGLLLAVLDCCFVFAEEFLHVTPAFTFAVVVVDCTVAEKTYVSWRGVLCRLIVLLCCFVISQSILFLFATAVRVLLLFSIVDVVGIRWLLQYR